MNKQGQMDIGGFVILFIGIIVALALLPAISDSTAIMTTQYDADNVSYTAGAADIAIDLAGQEVFGTPVITNASGSTLNASDYTVDERVSATDGGKTIAYITGAGSAGASQTINASYTYGDEGYAEEAGTRGVVNIILIFAGLGLLGFVIYYGIGKSGWMK